MGLDVEYFDSSEGTCECCGTTTRGVAGLVHDHDAERTVASYTVRWTVGHLAEHGASVAVVLGSWGDDSTAEDRIAVRLSYGWTLSGTIAFSVMDAELGNLAPIAGAALGRSEVIGTPLARNVFNVLDAIWLQDERLSYLSELAHWRD